MQTFFAIISIGFWVKESLLYIAIHRIASIYACHLAI